MRVRAVPGSRRLRRITSDCKPWPFGYDLLTCRGCGVLQTRVDSRWLSHIEKIYRRYAIYPQTRGVAEQKVVVAPRFAPLSRSAVIAEGLLRKKFLGAGLRILEIGAGAGFLLREIKKKSPGTRLYAVEKSPSCLRSIVRRGICAGVYEDLAKVPEAMDRILLIHTLEHIPFPAQFLAGLRGKMRERGKLFIQVPNTPSNPFLLTVADHCSHFTRASLIRCLAQGGWHPEKVWLSMGEKEISGIFSLAKRDSHGKLGGTSGVERQIRWLAKVESFFSRLRQKVNVFGTSLGGTWLASGHREKISAFLDEDPARVGSKFMGIPIRHPNQADRSVKMFSTVAFTVSNGLERKLQGLKIVKLNKR